MFDILLYAGKYRVIDFAMSVYVCVALTTWNIKYILIEMEIIVIKSRKNYTSPCY